jgi:ectoine hydroxylase-related dioxygenase (phytanoyl-CoA dioxygenase family)
MVQAAIALEERGVAEGCSIIVPGSHMTGTYTDREFGTTMSVPLKAGDVVLWDSRLWHGAHARTSTHMGWALIATFQMWWVKPRFDIPRALPQEIYEQLTPRQKALLGYCAQPPVDEYDGPQKKGYADLK